MIRRQELELQIELLRKQTDFTGIDDHDAKSG